MLRQVSVLDRPEQRRMHAHQEGAKIEQLDAVQGKPRTADHHDADLQRLHQADQPGLVHAVGNLAAGGRQQHERRNEDGRDEECRRRRVRIAKQCGVVGDQRGERDLEYVVVHGPQELGPEERGKAALLQQGKLARLAHRRRCSGFNKKPARNGGRVSGQR